MTSTFNNWLSNKDICWDWRDPSMGIGGTIIFGTMLARQSCGIIAIIPMRHLLNMRDIRGNLSKLTGTSQAETSKIWIGHKNDSGKWPPPTVLPQNPWNSHRRIIGGEGALANECVAVRLVTNTDGIEYMIIYLSNRDTQASRMCGDIRFAFSP